MILFTIHIWKRLVDSISYDNNRYTTLPLKAVLRKRGHSLSYNPT